MWLTSKLSRHYDKMAAMMSPESDWPVSYEASRADHARRWAATTPAQRLRWLEDAVRLALSSGALEPRGELADRTAAEGQRSG